MHKDWNSANVRFCLTYPEIYEVRPKSQSKKRFWCFVLCALCWYFVLVPVLLPVLVLVLALVLVLVLLLLLLLLLLLPLMPHWCCYGASAAGAPGAGGLVTCRGLVTELVPVLCQAP